MFANRILPLLPVALLLAACAGTANTNMASNGQAQFVPGDSGGEKTSPEFKSGYLALKNGDNRVAVRDLNIAMNQVPSDPYDALDLGAAYQNSGAIDRALPLYRTTIANGGGVYPVDVTQPDAKGMSLPEIARRNMRLAGYDGNGIAMSTSSSTTTSTIYGSQVAAAAPVPARTYEIFFEFNKSELTPAARDIIHQAAQNASHGEFNRVALTGHTDSVGSDAYNQALSERRAASVAAELRADGLPADMLATRGVGEAGQLVPTADGVREPQNRRTEVIEMNSPAS